MRIIKVLALAAAIRVLNPREVTAQPQIFNFVTIAGYAGYGSVDGVNSLARFHFPTSVASDSAGNVYVADTSSSTIRKLAPVGTNWVSSTIAGVAGNLGSADGTNGTVQFTHPQGVAVDSAGNVFVADSGNHTIRMLTLVGTNWVSSTIAGVAGYYGSDDGTNNFALFFQPQGVAADSGGNVYVADTSNSTVRKLTPIGTNWVSSTIAGVAGGIGSGDGTNDTVQFNYPQGVAVDGGGNVYVADTDNYTVRKLTPVGTNWVSSTVAGLAQNPGTKDGTNSVARFSNLYGLAVDSGTNIYVADTFNQILRKLKPVGTNWVSSTIAGLTNNTGWVDGTDSAARFNRPYGIAASSSGNVFVADSGNNTVRKLAPLGTNWVSTTIAGLSGSQGSADGTNTAAQFNRPYGVAADGAGNIYVADSGNNTIRKVTRTETNWVTSTIAGVAGIADSIDGTNTAARFYGPNGIAVDSGGNLYVADTVNSTIRKLRPVGTNWVSSTIAGLAGAPGSVDGTNRVARFANPWGIAVDSRTNLYVGDSWFSVIRKISPVGTNWVTKTIAGVTNSPGSADGTNTAATFWDLDGIAVDNGGSVYVADSQNHTIRKLTPVGTNWVSSTIAGLAGFYGKANGTNTAARFNIPHGVAVDAATNVYVADTSNDTIRMITPVGTNWVTSTIGGLAGSIGGADGTNSAARFWGPAGIAAGSGGNIYVLDTVNSTIRQGAIPPVPTSPPVFQTVMQSNGLILFTWSATAGRMYQLQYNMDLSTANWTNLGNTITATNTTISGSDALGPDRERAYRIELLP